MKFHNKPSTINEIKIENRIRTLGLQTKKNPSFIMVGHKYMSYKFNLAFKHGSYKRELFLEKYEFNFDILLTLAYIL